MIYLKHLYVKTCPEYYLLYKQRAIDKSITKEQGNRVSSKMPSP